MSSKVNSESVGVHVLKIATEMAEQLLRRRCWSENEAEMERFVQDFMLKLMIKQRVETKERQIEEESQTSSEVDGIPVSTPSKV